MKRKNPSDTNNCVFLFHHLCSPIYSSNNFIVALSIPPTLFLVSKKMWRGFHYCRYSEACSAEGMYSSVCQTCLVHVGIGYLACTCKHLLHWTSLRFHCAFDYTLKYILDCCNFVSMVIFSGVTCSNPNHDIWWNWDVCRDVRAFS